jgi:hypothetical protein
MPAKGIGMAMGIEEDPAFVEAAKARRDEAMVAGFIGECREDVPFAELFEVQYGGEKYTSCTHDPPHTRRVA